MSESNERSKDEASEATPQARRRLPVWKRLVISLVIMVLLIALMEAVLSIAAAIYYPRMTRTDPRFGWTYVETEHPVTRRFVVLGGKDIVYSMSINSDGFRDEDFAKRPDWLQIMVLGDSITFGLEADQEDLFCAKLEERLKDYLGTPKVDVMNFGITGFTTCQEALIVDEYVEKYSPNAVAIMLSSFNDFQDNANYSTSSRFRPHFRLDGDGLALYRDAPRLERIKAWFRDHSTIYFILSQRLPPFRAAMEASLDYTDEQKVELMRRILERIQGVCAAHGIPMFVFYMQNEESSLDRRDAIAAFCEANGIEFHEFPLWKRPGFTGNHHWGPEGHQKTTDVMFDVLSAHPLVRSRIGAGSNEPSTPPASN